MKKVKRFIAVMVSTVMLLMLVAYFPVSAVTSADLTISQNGIEFICSLEGFHSTCYSDYSQSSIGFGTKCNGSSVQPHASGLHSITREQAMIDMKAEIENSYIPNVRRQTSGISMNQNQFDALVSLTYNCGGGTTLIKNSPLVKYLRGELSESEARSQYSSYIVTAGGKVLQGLINRRNKEADLFFSGSVPPTDNPPTYSNISIPKTKYVIGENIVFIFSSDNATGYIMGLYRNGERYHTSPDMSDNSYVYTLNEAGDYYAYVTSYNSLGYKDSQAVYFSVYDSAPNESVISIDGDKYILGEDIQFSFSSDSATGYIMGIYRNGDRCHTSPDMSDNSYVYTPNEAGDYYAYVTSYNSLGYKDSQAVYFSVYDSAPNESNISIEKNKYKIGEKITFLFSSDVATGYIMGIDKNGERYYTSPNLTENNYTYSIAETGDYYAYVTSYNPLGYKDSIGVWFTVYDSNAKTADLNQDGSVTILDAVLLQKHLLNFKKLTTEQMKLADINSDGRVNILDMSLLKEKLK